MLHFPSMYSWGNPRARPEESNAPASIIPAPHPVDKWKKPPHPRFPLACSRPCVCMQAGGCVCVCALSMASGSTWTPDVREVKRCVHAGWWLLKVEIVVSYITQRLPPHTKSLPTSMFLSVIPKCCATWIFSSSTSFNHQQILQYL